MAYAHLLNPYLKTYTQSLLAIFTCIPGPTRAVSASSSETFVIDPVMMLNLGRRLGVLGFETNCVRTYKRVARLDSTPLRLVSLGNLYSAKEPEWKRINYAPLSYYLPSRRTRTGNVTSSSAYYTTHQDNIKDTFYDAATDVADS